jgi:hypothetical protein
MNWKGYTVCPVSVEPWGKQHLHKRVAAPAIPWPLDRTSRAFGAAAEEPRSHPVRLLSVGSLEGVNACRFHLVPTKGIIALYIHLQGQYSIPFHFLHCEKRKAEILSVDRSKGLIQV